MSVYGNFVFDFAFIFAFVLRKLTTSRPWPTPWPTPRFVPTRKGRDIATQDTIEGKLNIKLSRIEYFKSLLSPNIS